MLLRVPTPEMVVSPETVRVPAVATLNCPAETLTVVALRVPETSIQLPEALKFVAERVPATVILLAEAVTVVALRTPPALTCKLPVELTVDAARAPVTVSVPVFVTAPAATVPPVIFNVPAILVVPRLAAPVPALLIFSVPPLILVLVAVKPTPVLTFRVPVPLLDWSITDGGVVVTVTVPVLIIAVSPVPGVPEVGPG